MAANYHNKLKYRQLPPPVSGKVRLQALSIFLVDKEIYTPCCIGLQPDAVGDFRIPNT